MDRTVSHELGEKGVRETAMSDLIWATKKPTKTGWYWYRGGGDGHTEKVLHFIDDDGEGPYLATSDDVALKDLDGEWAGPVEPPLSG